MPVGGIAAMVVGVHAWQQGTAQVILLGCRLFAPPSEESSLCAQTAP